MWRGVLLLPLLVLSETLAAADHRLTALERSREHARHNTNDVYEQKHENNEASTTSANNGLTRWWSTVDSLLAEYSPVDSGLLYDLRLAFGPVPPQYERSTRSSSNSGGLYPRDQRVLKTKCRVKPPTPHHGDDGIPNYTPTDSAGHPLPTQTIGDGHGGGGREIIAVTTPCGSIPVGATVNTNASTGPNGQSSWLTCGIDPNSDATGWQPPYATVDQIITYQGGLRAAVLAEGSPYKACTKYVELFETAAGEFGVPAMYIAAFALQESGCNPDVDGGGGEQGMMQISPEKCADAPNGDCKDVVYNVRTAVKYFAEQLRAVGNNTFEAVGNYNGWFRGMNYTEATTWGINGDCCRCQRNLSYLTQFFNGWLQNIDAWSPWIGTIHNIDIC
ncbi:glycoside hydrolase family 23 protein [Serendipita vermifera MAFF 305830]|uniref:Glycoside hydrolase family 23 protein n=1 Tax=Serendipita vermifera MAFF 305830 TaxID=933852 RepID=A0A0C3AJT5_SERVB|nr:glycoside hydrolase family 23 protein [Serendipita vermifera MAFF 305830]